MFEEGDKQGALAFTSFEQQFMIKVYIKIVLKYRKSAVFI